jgi:hypothetical protein
MPWFMPPVLPSAPPMWSWISRHWPAWHAPAFALSSTPVEQAVQKIGRRYASAIGAGILGTWHIGAMERCPMRRRAADRRGHRPVEADLGPGWSRWLAGNSLQHIPGKGDMLHKRAAERKMETRSEERSAEVVMEQESSVVEPVMEDRPREERRPVEFHALVCISRADVDERTEKQGDDADLRMTPPWLGDGLPGSATESKAVASWVGIKRR